MAHHTLKRRLGKCFRYIYIVQIQLFFLFPVSCAMRIYIGMMSNGIRSPSSMLPLVLSGSVTEAFITNAKFSVFGLSLPLTNAALASALVEFFSTNDDTFLLFVQTNHKMKYWVFQVLAGRQHSPKIHTLAIPPRAQILAPILSCAF